MRDCKFLGECSPTCDGEKDCPDYEQDPQIARDNDTMKITEGNPDYEALLNKATGIIFDQIKRIDGLLIHIDNLEAEKRVPPLPESTNES